MYDPAYMLQNIRADGVPGMSSVTGDTYAQGGPPAGRTSLYGLSASDAYRSPMNMSAGAVNIQPLAQAGLEQYGVPGIIAGMAGNIYLSQMLRSQGLTSRGEAASHLQAITAYQRMQEQSAMVRAVAGYDTESISGVFKGMMTLGGMPLDTQQQEALQQFSRKVAEFGPNLNAFAPQIMSLLSGRTGLASSLAAPILDANRYNFDSATGRRGYSLDANKEMVDHLYRNIFSSDMTAARNGMRTEDFGAAYRLLSAEGLLQPKGTLQERTAAAARDAMRTSGTDLTSLISAGGGMSDQDTTLENLSPDQMQALRQNTSVQQQLRKSELDSVRTGLLAYNESLSAMREIFGENGNDNAPYQVLVNSLKALTNNQQQKFSPNELKNLARNIQAASQVTGQSLDDIFAQQQTANNMAAQMLGADGARFGPAIGARFSAARSAYRRAGAMTGPEAITEDEFAMIAGQVMTRTIGSEATNAYSALGRFGKSGVDYTDTVAGRRLASAEKAALAGQAQFTYEDETGKLQTLKTPTTNAGLVALAEGALQGVSAQQFMMAIENRRANMLHATEDTAYRDVGRKLMASDVRQTYLEPKITNDLNASRDLHTLIPDAAERATVLRRASAGLYERIDAMTEAERGDKKFVTGALRERLVESLRSEGKTVTPEMEQRLTGAVANIYAGMQQTLSERGQPSFDVLKKLSSGDIDKAQAEIDVQAMMAESLSPLSKIGGSLVPKFATALTRAGERGNEATLTQLAIDMTGTGSELTREEATKITELNDQLHGLKAKIYDASDADRPRLLKQARDISDSLTATVNTAVNRVDRATGGTTSFMQSEMASASPEDLRLARLGLNDLRNARAGEMLEQPSETMEERMRTLIARDQESWYNRANPLRTPTDSLPDNQTLDQYFKTLPQAQAAEEFDRASVAAYEQLNAEQTLRSEKQLKDPKAKIRSLSELRKALRDDSPLHAMLEGASEDDWLQVVADFADRNALAVYGGDVTGVAQEQNRWSAWATSPDNRPERFALTSQFATLSRFISGFDASVRNESGASELAKSAARSGKHNLDKLNAISRDYFGGDNNRMLASQGRGVTAEGVEKLRTEYDALTPGQADDVTASLRKAGLDIPAGQRLSFEQYQASVPLRLRNAMEGTQTAIRQAQEAVNAQPTLLKIPDAGDDQFSLKTLTDMFNPAKIQEFLKSVEKFSPEEQVQKMGEFFSGKTDPSTPPADPGAKTVEKHGSDVTKTPAPAPATAAAAASTPVETKISGTLRIVGDISGQGTFLESTMGKS